MIASFTIHNYRSISDATLDFRLPTKRSRRGREPSEIITVFECKDHRRTVRLLPCLGVWGPNGSGKSNLFRALHLFHSAILNGTTLPLPRAYEPNRLVAGERPTAFELEAYLPTEKKRTLAVRYRIVYDAKTILEESLTCDGVELLSREKCAPCELALARCSAPWIQALRDHFCFIDLWSVAGDGYTKQILARAERTSSDPDLFIAAISAVIAHLDIGIHKLERLTSPDAPPLLVAYHYNTLGEEVSFDITEESDGTQRLLFLVAELLSALARGQLIIADEMDRSIHALLFRALIRMCKSRAYNLTCAQICFSTHDLSLMEADTIAPEEVVLVGKVGVETQLETLATLTPPSKAPPSLKRFRERYLEGWYQNIPYPSL